MSLSFPLERRIGLTLKTTGTFTTALNDPNSATFQAKATQVKDEVIENRVFYSAKRIIDFVLF